MRSALLVLSVLILAPVQSAYSYPFLCSKEHQVHPTSKDRTVQTTIEVINNIANGPLLRTLAADRKHTYEFCWMNNEGQPHPSVEGGIGTMFWHGEANDGRKVSGIIYTLEMFNKTFSLVNDPKDAYLAALFVLYHEIGHATIYYGLESKELQNIVSNKDTLFWLHPLAEKYKGRETALFQALNGKKWGAETFADCYGAYIMGIAMLYPTEEGKPVKFYDRVLKQQFNQKNYEAAMQLAASIASQLVNQDEHGTAKERQSFVSYGVNVAAHYVPMMKLNAVKAANSALLACADMAYEQSQKKVAFKLRYGLNLEVPGRAFNPKLGY